MNVFDIIGPIMVGPSSSHTAGAVRIGRIARRLLGEEPIEVLIKFHGSFAKTYKGHGTDKAIIGGLLNLAPDDLGIRDSMATAEEIGMRFRFETVDIKDSHPNTALIEASGKSGKFVKLLGSSVGGGNIVIKKINGLDVEFTGQYNTILIAHVDAPGVVASVTKLLAIEDVNIAHMRVFRSHRGGEAMMIIETDQCVNEKMNEMLSELPKVVSVTVIEPI